MLRVFHIYYTIRSLLFFIGEMFLIILALWLSTLLLHHGRLIDEPDRISMWLRIVLITFIIQISLYYHDLYDFEVRKTISDMSLQIVQAIGIACLAISGIYFLYPQVMMQEGIFFIGLFFLLLLLVSWRILYMHLCQRDLFNERVFLIGDGSLARMILEKVNGSIDSGYKVAAIFSNPGGSSLAKESGVEHYNSYDQLCDIARENDVRKIVVALQERRGRSPIQALLSCKLQGIRVLDGVSFFESLSGKILASETTPSWLIFSDGFNRHKLVLAGKRCIDVCLSSLGLLVSAPLMGLIACAVKWSSPGPVFFKQARLGQMERTFQVVKFRTMRQDAEAQSGAVWATENDPRVTGLGRILRKLRLDELPQFWNVLKGEMSFVGPRPERPEFVQQLKQKLPYYGERHSVKPGLTGWAQVKYSYGASEEDALRKLEYDLFYIKHVSLLFDLYIVLKTIKTVLGGQGAR
jgi:sugar transferase (PEP-CTERM system associated)